MRITFDSIADCSRPVAEPGETISSHQVADLLHRVAVNMKAHPDYVVPTEVQWAVIDARLEAQAKALTLPEGWEPSLDGHSNLNGEWRKNFVRKDGAVCDAPCTADGSPVLTTADILRAYDAENPIKIEAPPVA